MMAVAAFAVSPIDVRSSANCPSTEAIVERLLPLLPTTVASARDGRDTAQIEVGAVHKDGAIELHLLLVRGDASVVGERRLSMRGTCQDLAEAVATVLAAWETQPLPATAPDLAPVPAVRGTAVPAQAQGSEPAPSRPLQLLLGAGAGVSLVGGLAASGDVDLEGGRVASHWQLRFALARETARQADLDLGHVDWLHTIVGLSVCWRVLDPSWLFMVDAGPMAGWATLTGGGFSPGRQQRAFEYGVAAGLRAGRNVGRWNVWAEWRSYLWVKGQRATLTGAPSYADLPPADTVVSLGISVRLFH